MLSSDSLDRLGRCESEESSKIISAAAGVVKAAIGPSENVKKHLVDWLTSSSGAGLGDGIGIRRAVMAVVSQHRDDLMSVFEKSLAQFGDQLYIKHSPVLQQEGELSQPDVSGKQLTTTSTRPSVTLGCGIHPQNITCQARHGFAFKRVDERHIEQTGSNEPESPLPWHTGGRSALRTCR